MRAAGYPVVALPGPCAAITAVVALICSALAAAALHRLGGPIAAVVWLLAPTTVFTMVPYTEAPFCAAAFWAWERAKALHREESGLFRGIAADLKAAMAAGGAPTKPPT